MTTRQPKDYLSGSLQGISPAPLSDEECHGTQQYVMIDDNQRKHYVARRRWAVGSRVRERTGLYRVYVD